MKNKIINFFKPKSKIDKVFKDMFEKDYKHGTINFNMKNELEITFTTGINGRGNVKQVNLGKYGSK
jgi:hypothetical protein